MVYIVFYRPFGNSSIIREKEITFTSVKVEGGGVLEINSNGRGMVLRGGTLEVQSGGVVVVDRIDIQVSRLIVDSSAHIHADGKVRKKTSILFQISSLQYILLCILFSVFGRMQL